MYEEGGLPHYDGTPQWITKEWITKEWTTNATDTQLAMIDNGNVEVSKGGVCTLPETYDSELGAKVSHYVCRRGDYPTKIVNMAGLYTTGILGVNILRTCTKLRDEGAPVLYG